MKKHNLVAAEAFGTFALVFAGCGAIIVNDLYGGSLGHLGVSLVFGLIVMTMIYSVGNISGAHLNPAVTLGFFFAGRLEASLVVPYVMAQIFGAFTAALILRYLFIDHVTLGATFPSTDLPRAFILEIVISFTLMFVILNVSTGHQEKGIMAGAAIGGVVALAALIAGPVTGASMNPARSLGPAIATLNFQSLWLYLLAPVLGAYLANPACRLIQGDECCPGEQALTRT